MCRMRKWYFKLGRESREKIQKVKVQKRACAEGVILIHGVFWQPASSLAQPGNVRPDPQGLSAATRVCCSGLSEPCSCFLAITGTWALTDRTCPRGFQKERRGITESRGSPIGSPCTTFFCSSLTVFKFELVVNI